MLDKVLSHLRKRRTWRAFGRQVRQVRTIGEFEQFVARRQLPLYVKYLATDREPKRAEAQQLLRDHAIDPAGKRVLDIGPGMGDMLDVARERGAATAGVDHDPFLIRWLQLRGHLMFRQNILRSLDCLHDNLFDLVHLRGAIVVEYFHLAGARRLRRLMQAIGRHCAPGGLAIVIPLFECRPDGSGRKIRNPLDCRFTATMLDLGCRIAADDSANPKAVFPLHFVWEERRLVDSTITSGSSP